MVNFEKAFLWVVRINEINVANIDYFHNTESEETFYSYLCHFLELCCMTMFHFQRFIL